MKKAAYGHYEITASNLKPLNDFVIVTDMMFEQRQTSAGIILLNDNGTGLGIRPRWAQVYVVGPEQTDVKPGDWICVAHGRWTRGIKIDDGTGKKVVHKVDNNDILLISDEPVNDLTMSDKV
jgi:co-chaperonin GroES (HSP10)